MQAMRVSLGKLGIVTAVKMKMVKEVPVKRTLRRGLTPMDFVSMLREAQEMYKKNKSLPEWMVESQIFWLVQLHEVRSMWNKICVCRCKSPLPHSLARYSLQYVLKMFLLTNISSVSHIVCSLLFSARR